MLAEYLLWELAVVQKLYNKSTLGATLWLKRIRNVVLLLVNMFLKEIAVT